MAAPSGVPALSSPVTAAGPQGICTPFPFHPDTGNLVPAGFYPYHSQTRRPGQTDGGTGRQ
jgi:hypothetical protein